MYYIWCDDDGIIGSSKVLIMVSNNLTTNHPSWLFFPSLPHWQARANTLHLNSYLFVLGCVCMFYLYLCFYFDLYLAENCRELAKSPKVTGQGFPLTEPCDQLVFMATSPLLGQTLAVAALFFGRVFVFLKYPPLYFEQNFENKSLLANRLWIYTYIGLCLFVMFSCKVRKRFGSPCFHLWATGPPRLKRRTTILLPRT